MVDPLKTGFLRYNPSFVGADAASFLGDRDRVLGMEIKGEAKAYPIKILNWHEVVNDQIGGVPVLITYCPLCGTGMVFDPQVRGRRLSFVVSGKLYNSNVLFYDKETESLWSQIKMEAVTGPMTGERLKLLPLEHTTWADWRAKHPQTKVLTQETGYQRDYLKDPYQGYEQDEKIFFPVAHEDPRLPRKARILGVVVNGQAKAYAFEALQPEVSDQVGGQEIRIEHNYKSRNAIIKNERGEIIPSVQAYWFAWKAFYPETEIYGKGER